MDVLRARVQYVEHEAGHEAKPEPSKPKKRPVKKLPGKVFTSKEMVSDSDME